MRDSVGTMSRYPSGGPLSQSMQGGKSSRVAPLLRVVTGVVSITFSVYSRLWILARTRNSSSCDNVATLASSPSDTLGSADGPQGPAGRVHYSCFTVK